MNEGQVRLLLVGLHNSGKTHYGAQLLGRLRAGQGQLKMDGAATNLGAFEEALNAIAEGRLAQHTSTETYLESTWPVITEEGRRAELVWPDYGGEQIRQILQGRRVGDDWRRRIRESNGWLLFLRPHTISGRQDVWERPGTYHDKTSNAPKEAHWREQASLVELLQILLHTRGADVNTGLGLPVLIIGLTCWDEMSETMKKSRPSQVLQRTLPMVASFVDANWESNRHVTFGISALGKALQMDGFDDDFQNLGPTAHGWVIAPDGIKTPDLTAPVHQLISLTASS